MHKNKETVKDDELKKKKINKDEELNDKAVRIFDEVLESDEKIIKVYRPDISQVYFINLFKPFVMYLMFVIVFFTLYFFPLGVSKSDSLIFLLFVTCLTVFLEVIVILITKLSLKNTYYLVTNYRIITSDGIFECNFNCLEMKNIKDVQIKWGVIDKLIGKKTGHINFFPTTKEFPVLHFYKVNKPLDIYLNLQEMIEKTND